MTSRIISAIPARPRGCVHLQPRSVLKASIEHKGVLRDVVRLTISDNHTIAIPARGQLDAIVTLKFFLRRCLHTAGVEACWPLPKGHLIGIVGVGIDGILACVAFRPHNKAFIVVASKDKKAELDGEVPGRLRLCNDIHLEFGAIPVVASRPQTCIVTTRVTTGFAVVLITIAIRFKLVKLISSAAHNEGRVDRIHAALANAARAGWEHAPTCA
mmetsp:Transcript_86146/g.139758  ORF Transcript_86146/g.139758 Transcript_86146/m.139758 type:complete len:214 (-) Transcript_86146:2694-3335(-)